MPARILVIDGDEAILDRYEDLLVDDGHHVMLSRYIFADAASVEQTNPDLIIVDCFFGRDAKGLRMLEALKRHPTTAGIPIIVCTATAGATLRALDPYLDDRRVRLIAKPFQVEEISAAVFDLLALGPACLYKTPFDSQ